MSRNGAGVLAGPASGSAVRDPPKPGFLQTHQRLRLVMPFISPLLFILSIFSGEVNHRRDLEAFQFGQRSLTGSQHMGADI